MGFGMKKTIVIDMPNGCWIAWSAASTSILIDHIQSGVAPHVRKEATVNVNQSKGYQNEVRAKK